MFPSSSIEKSHQARWRRASWLLKVSFIQMIIRYLCSVSLDTGLRYIMEGILNAKSLFFSFVYIVSFKLCHLLTFTYFVQHVFLSFQGHDKLKITLCIFKSINLIPVLKNIAEKIFIIISQANILNGNLENFSYLLT